MNKIKVVIVVLLLFVLTLNVLAQSTLIEIQKQAERDAKADVNSKGWFLVGAGVGLISCYGGLYAGYTITRYNDNDDELPTAGFPCPNIGCLTATYLSGVIGSPLLIYSLKPTIPDRLLGKIAAYIETYTKTLKKQRMKHTAFGSVAGTAFTAIFLLSQLKK